MKLKPKDTTSTFPIIAMVLASLMISGGAVFAQEKVSPEADSRMGTSAQQEVPEAQQSELKQKGQQAQKEDSTSDQKRMSSGKTVNGSSGSARTESMSPANVRNYRPFVGREVRSERGDAIGEIDNVVVSEDGQQIKAVLAVGGFLGLGEKRVLISLDELRFDPKTDYVIYRGTEQDLETRAEYEVPEERRQYAGRPYSPYLRGPGYERGYARQGYPPYVYEDRRYRGEGRWDDSRPERSGRQYDDRYGRGYPYDEEGYGRGYYGEPRFGRYPYREEGYGREPQSRYWERPYMEDRYGRKYDDQRGQDR